MTRHSPSLPVTFILAGAKMPIHLSSMEEYYFGLQIKRFMTRKGNPNWGKLIPLGPALPTAFEIQARRLRLTPADYAFSAELRHWCLENRNRCYIPEWLLDTWHIRVDPDVSSAA